MDYTLLRKFIVKRLLEVTMKWNDRTSSYAVKPQNLTEQQQVVWTMLTNSQTIGKMSEMESRAFRNMAEEVLGAKIPDSKNKNLSEFEPYVCLTCVSTDMGIAGAGKVVMKKFSGAWVGPTGRTLNRDTLQSNWLRLPTQEEIEDLVNGIPDENVLLPFSGLFTFKKNDAAKKSIIELLTTQTKATFDGRPTCSIEGKEFEMYSMSRNVADDARRLIFRSIDMVFDTDKYVMVDKYLDSSFSPSNFTALVCKAFPEGVVISTSSSSVITPKGVEAIDTLEWKDVNPANEEQIKKLANTLPINLIFGYLPKEIQDTLVSEVKLE